MPKHTGSRSGNLRYPKAVEEVLEVRKINDLTQGGPANLLAGCRRHKMPDHVLPLLLKARSPRPAAFRTKRSGQFIQIERTW